METDAKGPPKEGDRQILPNRASQSPKLKPFEKAKIEETRVGEGPEIAQHTPEGRTDAPTKYKISRQKKTGFAPN